MKPTKMQFEIETPDCRTGFILVTTGMDRDINFNTNYLHVTSNLSDSFYHYHHGQSELPWRVWHNFRPDEILNIVIKHARSLFGTCSVKGPKYI